MTGAERSSDLLLRVGSRAYAIPLRHVVETMPALPIAAMENAPSYVLGIAIVRGVPTPVVDLGALFERAHTSPLERFVSLRVADRIVALAVSEVLSVTTLASDTLSSLPPLLGDVAHSAIESLGRLDAELVVVLRASRLVPEGVLDALAAETVMP